MWFSFTLFSSLFLFFKKFIVFSYFASLLFSFVNSLFDLFLFALAKVIDVCQFLFVNTCLFSHSFIVIGVFPHSSHLDFVLVRFKHDVKVAFQIETSFFGRAVNFWINVGINILEYALAPRKTILQKFKVFFVLFNKISNCLEHFWLEYIFSIQVNKVLFFADKLVVLNRHALSPEHINHFVLCFICKFSIKRKEI